MKKKNYIVYQITNKKNDKIYIGCHVTENIDDGYMGSGTNIKKALSEFGKENFDKIILHNFDNEKDMLEKEEQLVNKEFISRDDTYNIIVGGNQFLSTDTVTVKDKNGNTHQVHKNDPRYLSGELHGITTGKVTVKDKNGNYYKVEIDNKKYLQGKYLPMFKNMITVKNKEGLVFKIDKSEYEYRKNELEKVSNFKNMIQVRDENNIPILVSKDDPRYLSGELKFYWLGKKHTLEARRKIGVANSIKQRGENNSQFGLCWIYNIELKENKKIKKDDLNIWLEKGWKKGRKMKF